MPKFVLNENVLKFKNLNIFHEDRMSEKMLYLNIFVVDEKWVNIIMANMNPTEMKDILDACDMKFYPNINFLLKINPTISATAVERLFSTLKSLKTLLPNEIRNEHLTELASISSLRSIYLYRQSIGCNNPERKQTIYIIDIN